MGAIRALKGTPGTHTHRDNHVRVRGGEVVVGEQRRQCGGTGPAGVGRWYIVQSSRSCRDVHAHAHTHAHMHTRTHAHAHAHAYAHTHAHAHNHAHRCTYPSHTYTHAHTHTHLHCERPLRCRSVRRAELVLHRLLTAPSRRAFGACCARRTSMSISAYMRGRRERERGHFTFTYEDGLEDDAAGRRLGSAAEANPTKSEKSRQGLGRWDHFRDGTCVTASHERSRRGREPPVHPPTGLVSR
jgi:hypothetical protein